MPAFVEKLTGERVDPRHITCDMTKVDSFSGSVNAATRAVPIGETRTYGEIAKRLGHERLARRVGRALARNPLPIVVPCHRVIGANGRLTGFSAHGSVETKRRMLVIEGALLGETPGLFENLPQAKRKSRQPYRRVRPRHPPDSTRAGSACRIEQREAGMKQRAIRQPQAARLGPVLSAKSWRR